MLVHGQRAVGGSSDVGGFGASRSASSRRRCVVDEPDDARRGGAGRAFHLQVIC